MFTGVGQAGSGDPGPGHVAVPSTSEIFGGQVVCAATSARGPAGRGLRGLLPHTAAALALHRALDEDADAVHSRSAASIAGASFRCATASSEKRVRCVVARTWRLSPRSRGNRPQKRWRSTTASPASCAAIPSRSSGHGQTATTHHRHSTNQEPRGAGGTFWFATGMDGTRFRRSKFFPTEEAAQAFKAAREQAAAALPAPPEPLTVPGLRRPRLGPALSKTATARPGSLTLREFGDDWLARSLCGAKPPPNGHTRNCSPITSIRISATFASAPLHSARNRSWAARARAPDPSVTWGTQKAVLRVVSSCLRWAVRYRHLQTNPCARAAQRSERRHKPGLCRSGAQPADRDAGGGVPAVAPDRHRPGVGRQAGTVVRWAAAARWAAPDAGLSRVVSVLLRAATHGHAAWGSRGVNVDNVDLDRTRPRSAREELFARGEGGRDRARDRRRER